MLERFKPEDMTQEEILEWMDENSEKWEVLGWKEVFRNGEGGINQRVRLGENEYLIRATRSGYPLYLEKNPPYEGLHDNPNEDSYLQLYPYTKIETTEAAQEATTPSPGM